jgi:long-subunit acyl-CoA synthetase (AMP-forming)
LLFASRDETDTNLALNDDTEDEDFISPRLLAVMFTSGSTGRPKGVKGRRHLIIHGQISILDILTTQGVPEVGKTRSGRYCIAFKLEILL